MQNITRKGPTLVVSKPQIVDGNNTTPPNVPGGQRFVPRRDREVIAYAFFVLGRSIQWLSRTNRLPHRTIEGIIRDEHENRLARVESLFTQQIRMAA